MKPLNFKERDDKFFYFVIAGTITLVITIFCFYFTNDFLSDAISIKKRENYNRFLEYGQREKQYVMQLDQINKALNESLNGNFSENANGPELISNLAKNGDTTVLVNKLIDLSQRNFSLIGHIKESRFNLKTLEGELRICKDKTNKIK